MPNPATEHRKLAAILFSDRVGYSALAQRSEALAVLEGSVRKAGNQQRLAAQLIRVRAGLHLFSERYGRRMQDVFDSQGDITRAIVGGQP